MRFFYNLFVHLYPILIRFAAIWNPKAKKWVQGRKNLFESLEAAVAQSKEPIIWMHSASLGEFEQGRPVLERIKSEFPHYRILLTFFSPSGYEVRKNYAAADLVFYLPMDSRRNATRFLEITSPQLALFIKYETWYNYLSVLEQKKVPALLISAVVYPHQFTLSFWSDFMKKTLSLFKHIFAQSDDALEILKEQQIATGYSLGGDTRYDRVNYLAELSFEHDGITRFKANQQLLVAGSTWTDDEKILREFLNQDERVKLIIAPHETHPKNIKELQTLFPESILYSQLEQTTQPEAFRVLIIDCIGLLSKLYRFATITYVGGGFNRAGIHNILEAAAYGKMVVFGPQFEKSNEAKEMIQQSLAYSFSNSNEFNQLIHHLLSNPTLLEEKNKQSANFVKEHTGATEKIIAYIKKEQLL